MALDVLLDLLFFAADVAAGVATATSAPAPQAPPRAAAADGRVARAVESARRKRVERQSSRYQKRPWRPGLGASEGTGP